jgi:hypothetical protein
VAIYWVSLTDRMCLGVLLHCRESRSEEFVPLFDLQIRVLFGVCEIVQSFPYLVILCQHIKLLIDSTQIDSRERVTVRRVLIAPISSHLIALRVLFIPRLSIVSFQWAMSPCNIVFGVWATVECPTRNRFRRN